MISELIGLMGELPEKLTPGKYLTRRKCYQTKPFAETLKNSFLHVVSCGSIISRA